MVNLAHRAGLDRSRAAGICRYAEHMHSLEETVLLPSTLKGMTLSTKWSLYQAFCEKFAKVRCAPERFQNFQDSLERIAEGNVRLRHSSVVLGVTQFCDRSLEELAALAPTHSRSESSTGRRVLGSIRADMSAGELQSFPLRQDLSRQCQSILSCPVQLVSAPSTGASEAR